MHRSENEIPSIQSCLIADNGKIQKLYRYMSNNVFCQVFQNLGLWTTTLVEEWIAIYCCKICLWYRSSKIKKVSSLDIWMRLKRHRTKAQTICSLKMIWQMTSQTQKMHQTWQDYFERACSKNCNAIIDAICNK